MTVCPRRRDRTGRPRSRVRAPRTCSSTLGVLRQCGPRQRSAANAPTLQRQGRSRCGAPTPRSSAGGNERGRAGADAFSPAANNSPDSAQAPSLLPHLVQICTRSRSSASVTDVTCLARKRSRPGLGKTAAQDCTGFAHPANTRALSAKRIMVGQGHLCGEADGTERPRFTRTEGVHRMQGQHPGARVRAARLGGGSDPRRAWPAVRLLCLADLTI